MIFGFQPFHLVIIFLVALVVFGPNRLPEIGRGLGKAIVEFRKGTREITESFREGFDAPAGAQPVVQPSSDYRGMRTGNFCTQCGAPNPLEARFCNQCGSSLPGAEPAASAEQTDLASNHPGDMQPSS